MVQTVHMPNGQIARFPDEATPAQIEAALQAQTAAAVSPAAPVPAQPEQSMGAGLIQEALQGATLGFSEEIQAGVAAATAKVMDLVGSNPSVLKDRSFGQLFDEALQGLRTDQSQFSAQHPVASTLATVGGGLATGGAALKALQLAGAPVIGLAGVAGTGAGLGAVAGAGVSEEGGRLEGAFTGAALGAVTGLTVSGLGGLGRAIGRRLAPGVNNRLRALADQSGLTPAQIQTRLSALGPRSTLADVANVFQRGADVAATRLGPTARRVQQLIRRDETQFSRIIEPIRRTLGGQAAAARTVSQLKDLRIQESSPLYERAFNAGLRPTNRLNDLLRRPETQKAWRSVQSIGRSDPDVDVSVFGQGTPSFRGWQAITEQLSDRASSLSRTGKNKFASTIGNLRKSILEELDAQSPEFQQARALWSGTKRADDMLELGRDFLKLSSDDVTDALRTMSDSDKTFFRLGVGRAIEERLAKTTDTNDLGRLFRNQSFRDKAMAAFPDRESAVDFLNTVRAETIKKATTNAVDRGSQTKTRQIAEKQMTGQAIGVGDLSRQGILNRAMTSVSGPREKTIQELGELLLSQDPAVQQRALQIIAGAENQGLLQLGGGGAGSAGLAGLLGARQ